MLFAAIKRSFQARRRSLAGKPLAFRSVDVPLDPIIQNLVCPMIRVQRQGLYRPSIAAQLVGDDSAAVQAVDLRRGAGGQVRAYKSSGALVLAGRST